MEHDQAAIAAQIRDSLMPFVGQDAAPATLADMKSAILATLPQTKGPAPEVELKSAWAWMGWKDRLRWFAYTKWPLRRAGDAWRGAIERENTLLYAIAELAETNPILDDIASSPMDVPLFLLQKPKEHLHSKIKMRLPQPITFIDVTITL